MQFLKKRLKTLVLRMLKPIFDELNLCTYKVYGSKERLHISKSAKVANTLFNTFSGNIYVHDHVFTGHNVSILTGTHDYRLVDEKRMNNIPSEGRDIIIEQGVWVSSNALIIGPCTIGRNSVIAAGAIVSRDVPKNVTVAGCPAKIIKKIICE
jgi:acetyltransferase-like isoleucine patch superfamily enzyme